MSNEKLPGIQTMFNIKGEPTYEQIILYIIRKMKKEFEENLYTIECVTCGTLLTTTFEQSVAFCDDCLGDIIEDSLKHRR